MLLDELNEQDTSVRSKINVKKIVYKIVRNFPWLIVGIVLSFIAAKVYLRYQVPISSASSNILVKTGDASGNPNTLNIIGDPFDADKTAENEVFILHSYGLVQRIIDSMNLDITITKDGLIKKVPVDVQSLPFQIIVKRKENLNSRRNYKLTINPSGYEIAEDGKKYKKTYG